jgi:hypothetical protein
MKDNVCALARARGVVEAEMEQFDKDVDGDGD